MTTPEPKPESRRWARGHHVIEMINECAADGSTISRHAYAHHYKLGGNDPLWSSQYGLTCVVDGNPVSSVLCQGRGGTTSVHENSCVLLDDRCLIALGDQMVALHLPDLALMWSVTADHATCFGLHLTADEQHVIVHGEMEISKFTTNGLLEGSRGGRDIFTGTFALNGDEVQVTDFNGETYRFPVDEIDLQ